MVNKQSWLKTPPSADVFLHFLSVKGGFPALCWLTGGDKNKCL